MNTSMWKKVWGDIRTRKGRTFLVVVSIFIGVLGVVTLISAGDILVSQLEEDIQQNELPMISSFVSVPGSIEGSIDNDAVIETITDYPGVTVVDGEASYPVFWHDSTETRFRESQINAYTMPLDAIALQPMRLVEGDFPVEGQNQLAVEQRMADDFDLEIGETITVRILGTEADVQSEEWTISGIVFHPYNQAASETLYATYADAQRIAGFQGLNSIFVRFEDFPTAEAALNDITALINDQTDYVALFTQAEDPATNSLVENTQQFAIILAALAVIAMLVSGFLVINVVSNIVAEQRRQIGVIKSLGASRMETFAMYAGIALIYGLLGMIPGVLLGIPVGYQLAVLIGELANTLIDEFAISNSAIVLGIALGLAVPVIAASIPVYSGTRVSILEAMTDLGLSGSRKIGPLARLVRALPLPINIKQSLSNVLSKKGRLALTVTTLTLAVAAFMGVTAVFVSIDEELQSILSTFQYDITVQPTSNQDIDTIRTILVENVDEVDAVYPGSGFSGQMEGYVSDFTGTSQIIIIGVDTTASLLDFDLQAGTAWNDDPSREGIVLTNEIASGSGAEVGDLVNVTVAGNLVEVKVIGIASFPFPVAFMQWENVATLAGFVAGAPQANSYFTTLSTDATGDGQVAAWGIDGQTAGFIGGGAELDGGVFISEELAASSSLAESDTITLAGESYPINAVFSLPPQLEQNNVATEIVAFDWQQLAVIEGRSLEGEPIPNSFLVTTETKGLSPREVDEIIEDINDALVAEGITSSFTNQAELSATASETILSIGIVLNIASGVMAAVGAIGLVTTLSISVFERQKEIGVMRSTGAKSPVIIVQFLVEGLVVGIIAWIIGVPLSVAISVVLNDLLPFGDFIPYSYSVLMPLVGFIGVLVIATVASIGPSLSASRKTVSEILRYQ